ncbi:MAG: DNA-formamidopyrimidine glycosylase, partial [Candidatus Chisholmbacteria bacterium]|nr:DNA-formamidopyrimidine glycosylase [Candidatus Chisholmbacteria bacterium]
MPELPEVETIARQLNSVLVGQRTVGVEVKQGR